MNNTIKVCTYNVGGWVDGVRTGLYPEEISQRMDGWKEFLTDFEPDFLIMEEAANYFDAAKTMDAYETLFKSNYPYTARIESEYKCTKLILVCGKYPINNMQSRNFTSGSMRAFVTFDTVVGDRKLTAAAVHLSIEGNSEGIRQKDLAELAECMAHGEIDIAAGDFNTFTIGEFDIFKPYAQLANHGKFGDYETWPHTAGKWNRCIDNIIVRNGLSIEAVRLGSCVLSDHMPFMAQISY